MLSANFLVMDSSCDGMNVMETSSCWPYRLNLEMARSDCGAKAYRRDEVVGYIHFLKRSLFMLLVLLVEPETMLYDEKGSAAQVLCDKVGCAVVMQRQAKGTNDARHISVHM